MTVSVHRSDHPEHLVGALCDVIAAPLRDPFTAEILAVPTRGIERWLNQQISSALADRGIGDGIAANIDFPSPRQLIDSALSQFPDTARSIEAWSSRAVVPHVEQIIDEHSDEEWMWLIKRFVAGPDGDGAGAQRLLAAQKIGRLFSSYARYRPLMIQAWSVGEDVGPDGRAISLTAAWQPRMWRLLLAQIGVPPTCTAVPDALARVRSGTSGIQLPERLSVYGVTSLDPADLAAFHAFGAASDIHLFVLHPSPALWAESAPILDEIADRGFLVRRTDDPTRDAPKNPLLRSWAQESRELQLVLAQAGLGSGEPRTSTDGTSTTLLAAIQADIRANRRPSAQSVVDPDRSIQIHACYGAQRQVEALRDAILHILNDDPTIEPRDIVIMTPDLDAYVPLIEAAFPGPSDGGDLPDLRVRIADRAPTRTNPLVGLAATVVDLATSRLGTGTVVQLLSLPEVQRRLGIGPDAVADIVDLIDTASIRWGRDAEHRAENAAGHRDEHTWRRGIDRVLAGVFFDDDPVRVVGDVAPLANVEGQVAASAGGLAQVVDRLRAIGDLLATPAPLSAWADRISDAVRLIAQPARDDDWQWGQLRRLLEETFPVETPGLPDPQISLGEVAVLISPWTDDRTGILHQRTGCITVCTLAPMRSVPYRVVCLLGLEHDRFPRSSRRDGDDLLIDDEAVGDPDRSAEDRQLLLDAVMAASDHLVITYTGRDPLTNAAYPPAVPVAELTETITAMIGEDAAGLIRVDHPLQSFSPVVFTPGKLGLAGPWGFDPTQFAGAVALTSGSIDASAAVDLAIVEEEVEEPSLDRLIAYLRGPSKAFLRNSLGVFIPEIGDPPDEELPTGLNGLERWSVTDRLLSGRRQGRDAELLIAHERAADMVPAGELGTPHIDEARDLAQRIEQVAVDRGCWDTTEVPITGSVAVAGQLISGSVPANVTAALVADVGPSRPKPSRRLTLYAQVVFLTALEPERAWHGILIGKGEKDQVAVVTIGPLAGDTAAERSDDARERLATLANIHSAGMAEPLPIFPESSFVWATSDPDERRAATRKVWEPNWKGERGEGRESAHRMLFDDLAAIADLAESDFPDWAVRLWEPILSITTEENA